MLVRLQSAAITGIKALPVSVEVCVTKGVGYQITGLPDESIKESLSRISIALQECGFSMPRTKLVINLSPANIRKSGSAFDLPIALGILLASGQMEDCGKLSSYLIAGEISLDATVCPIPGAICLSELALQAGLSGLICPMANAGEASLVKRSNVFPIGHLKEILPFIQSDLISPVSNPIQRTSIPPVYQYDFKFVNGQHRLKRAMEVAAAGGHHLLTRGFPGSGKSLLAKCLPSILPPMNEQEMLETTKIRSLVPGRNTLDHLIAERPFCEIHPTISEVGLFGGGMRAQPGQITIAHNGVLFMDEFSEFKSSVLEALRQPLEERRITVARSKVVIEYPAAFMLVAAMNPCACGYHNHPTILCSCSNRSLWWHNKKLSGPILDRFDLCTEAEPIEGHDIFHPSMENESSATIRQRVMSARSIQDQRLQQYSHIHSNAQLPHDLISVYCHLEEHAKNFLQRSWEKNGLSMRSLDKTLRVARTIADLAGSVNIELPHIAEALSYHFHLPVLKQTAKPYPVRI